MYDMPKYSKNQTDRLLSDLGYDLVEECRHAVSIADIDPEITVLDVATGSGRMAGVLSENVHTVCSGDISCDSLPKMRQRLGDIVGRGITFIPFDARHMPFPDESFGAVVCANALHEMQNPESVISEMTRVCSRDGRLVITDFNDRGFGVMEKVHQRTHGGEHNRGSITAEEIGRQLSLNFADIRHHTLALNDIWVAAGRASAADAGRSHTACFACGDHNQHGLRLNFQSVDEHMVRATCILGRAYQGYPDIAQGGIVSTILDSAMTNCLFFMGVEALTARLSVRFREPVEINQEMTVTASLVTCRGRFYELKAAILQDGRYKASAEGKFLRDKPATKASKEG